MVRSLRSSPSTFKEHDLLAARRHVTQQRQNENIILVGIDCTDAAVAGLVFLLHRLSFLAITIRPAVELLDELDGLIYE